ncbi:hypothetical protein QFZ94_000689 [Paraburkholderia sp. JPY465]
MRTSEGRVHMALMIEVHEGALLRRAPFCLLAERRREDEGADVLPVRQ